MTPQPKTLPQPEVLQPDSDSMLMNVSFDVPPQRRSSLQSSSEVLSSLQNVANNAAARQTQTLGQISERLSKKESSSTSSRIGVIGRVHAAPHRTLEQDYRMTSKVLGTGYNGKIRLATTKHGNNRRPVAVKTFKVKGLNPNKLERLNSEIEVFLRMDHPHVARLLDVYETNTQINVVMECAEGGELFDRVLKCKCFSERDAAEATKQMLLALHYVHGQGIVHRDLKCENFLYEEPEGKHLKMIDFGFSKHADAKTRMKTSCGTLAYAAPEVLKRSYTKACDLWSMGVIVFILLSGHLPFHGESRDQMKSICRAHYVFKPEYWRNVSRTAVQYVQSLLEANPSKRMTSKMALEHKWITENCDSMQVVDISSVIGGLSSWCAAPKLKRACTAMMAWSLTNHQQSKVRDYFLALDTDCNGTISRGELQAAMQDKFHMPEGELVKVFDILDGEEIHYSDFLSAMISSCIVPVDDDLLRATFAKFDIDASGHVDSREFCRIFGDAFEWGDVGRVVSGDTCRKDGKMDFQHFANYARAYHAGTLLNNTRPAETKQLVDGIPVEIAPSAANENGKGTTKPCCIVQ
jgi:calcium-dependent protein kinase